jgi:hypothetical protein
VRIKSLVSASALMLALAMAPVAPALAADAPASAAPTAASADKWPGGKATQSTIEVALPRESGGGIGTQDIILCTLSVNGWYAGSGRNYVAGAVLCPVVVNSIAITFQWYRSSGGAPLRIAAKTPCFNKIGCGKSDGLVSYATLIVIACASVVKAGYTSAYSCAADGPF